MSRNRTIKIATQPEMRRCIEFPSWPEGLEASHIYQRQHDDTDGAEDGHVCVVIAGDGDAWVSTDAPGAPALRYRTHQGGGGSVRTRNALMLLAYAIMLDEKEGRL